MRYKVSGAIAIPKASWGCAPALPNRMRLVSLRAVNSELGSFKKMQLQQGSQIAKFHLFRKCGLFALNLASIFEKVLDQKTFCLPAARILQPNFYVAFMSCFT